jgi:hypothetical protein
LVCTNIASVQPQPPPGLDAHMAGAPRRHSYAAFWSLRSPGVPDPNLWRTRAPTQGHWPLRVRRQLAKTLNPSRPGCVKTRRRRDSWTAPWQAVLRASVYSPTDDTIPTAVGRINLASAFLFSHIRSDQSFLFLRKDIRASRRRSKSKGEKYSDEEENKKIP